MEQNAESVIPWTTICIVHGTYVAMCARCSALVPKWNDAILNHERWHAQIDDSANAR